MTLNSTLTQTGNAVVYRPALVGIAGSINATILLDQMIYWAEGLQKTGQWFFMTQETITQRTGLSRYEQESARKKLKSRGYLMEKYSGVPRKLYFQLNESAINESWEIYQKTLENHDTAKKQHACKRKSPVPVCEKSPDLSDKKTQAYKQDSDTATHNTTNQSGSAQDILSLFMNTPFSKITETSISRSIEKYGFDHVFITSDVLVYQSRSGKQIGKPAAYFASCLKTGVLPPDGFVPFLERELSKKKEPSLKDDVELQCDIKAECLSIEDLKKMLNEQLPWFGSSEEFSVPLVDKEERLRLLRNQADQLTQND